MSMTYRVRLKAIHDKTGKTPYDVVADLKATPTPLSTNTVRRYTENEEVLTDQLHISVAMLARYYGVSVWDVVEVVKSEEDEEINTAFAALA